MESLRQDERQLEAAQVLVEDRQLLPLDNSQRLKSFQPGGWVINASSVGLRDRTKAPLCGEEGFQGRGFTGAVGAANKTCVIKTIA